MSEAPGRPRLRRAGDALARLGLAAPAFRLYERWRALGASADDPDLPPRYLRVLTTGDPDPELFRRLGRAAADEALAIAAESGLGPTAQDRILDFGCGCGRVTRHLIAARPAAVHGCDVDPRLVAWSRTHLAGDFRVIRPAPPTDYRDGDFSLIYALSVFTHLKEGPSAAWLAELARLTRPGGLAVLSLFDEDTPAAAPFREALLLRGTLVRRDGPDGTNLLAVYTSRARFAELAGKGWEPVAFRPALGGATGQALAVLRRR